MHLLKAKAKLFLNLLVLTLACLGQGQFFDSAYADEKHASATMQPQVQEAIGSSDTIAVNASTTLGDNFMFLPLVYKDFPLPPPIFGIESYYLGSGYYLDRAASANVNWARYSVISWKDIEPVRTQPSPTYHWETVDETALRGMSEYGLTTIATVKFTPSWAQKIPGHSCGPIAAAALDEYAQFLKELVQRYSGPPFNIKYWEFGNEVDVDPDTVPPDAIYGCWGDEDDPYYGGRYYATMLKYAYPAIKSVDPQAKILIGGLIQSCDPTYHTWCKAGKFLDGILVNNGAPYFDIISYHGYAYYVEGLIVDDTYSNWAHRGGLVLGKIDYFNSLMATYKIDKPLMLTEASMICRYDYQCPDYNDFLEAQADYVVWVYTRTWAANLLGTFWYTLEGPGWRGSGLLDGGSDKPAYIAYKFMAEELDLAKFSRKSGYYPGVETYIFNRDEKDIWVLWVLDRSSHTITLPGSTLNVYDKYGNSVQPVANQITFDSPIYLEISR